MSKPVAKKKTKKAPKVQVNIAKAGQPVQLKKVTEATATHTHSHSSSGGLGRGLDSLISRDTTKAVGGLSNAPLESPVVAPDSIQMPVAPSAEAIAEANGKNVITVPIQKIKPSPWQPRHVFDDEALAELASEKISEEVKKVIFVLFLHGGERK